MDNNILIHTIYANYVVTSDYIPYVKMFKLPTVAKRIVGIRAIIDFNNSTGQRGEAELVLNNDTNHLVVPIEREYQPGMVDMDCDLVPDADHCVIIHGNNAAIITLKLLT